MRTAHLCNGLGGSLWAGAILGWQSIYALDNNQWRCEQVRLQAAAGWWPGLHVECADLTDWQPPTLDGGVDLLAAGFSCRDISCAGLWWMGFPIETYTATRVLGLQAAAMRGSRPKRQRRGRCSGGQ